MGLTLLFIAHDLSMVRHVSDRMAVMYLGSLVEIGTANEVYFEPRHPYTQLLVGSNPEPDPKIERNRASASIEGEIPSPVNIPPGCRFAGRCPKVMDVCRQLTPRTDSPARRRPPGSLSFVYLNVRATHASPLRCAPCLARAVRVRLPWRANGTGARVAQLGE